MNDLSKTRVLFVDDEEMILELLQFQVAPMQGEWETSFAGSGDAALSLMARRPFDIVVSDMRMPGMNGAQLLNEVMKRHPATVRIILSGFAEEEQVLKCIGSTHQFLSKPFELGGLKASLDRCQRLKSRLPNREIQKLLATRTRLPCVPAVYLRILEALNDPECPAERIGEIVATDPGLTAKILQLVNSAFFGFAREVSDAEEAVVLLGMGTIRSLALTVPLFTAFSVFKSEVWSVDRVWAHSLQVARMARRLAEMETDDESLCEQTFTAGLLHDVGKLILADALREDYVVLIARAHSEQKPLSEIERAAIGATHADVGAYLLGLWGLPGGLVEAVALHEEPGLAIEPTFASLTAVHVANSIASQTSSAPESTPSPIDSPYLEKAGLTHRLQAWREKLASL